METCSNHRCEPLGFELPVGVGRRLSPRLKLKPTRQGQRRPLSLAWPLQIGARLHDIVCSATLDTTSSGYLSAPIPSETSNGPTFPCCVSVPHLPEIRDDSVPLIPSLQHLVKLRDRLRPLLFIESPHHSFITKPFVHLLLSKFMTSDGPPPQLPRLNDRSGFGPTYMECCASSSNLELLISLTL